jgi:hypothetical protein
VVKFTVTPLGGARADTARVVDSIVRYLQPPPKKGPGAGTGQPPRGGGGPERYYADRGEEPGRWLGRTAQAAGLVGVVERHDFATVLAGRNPHTGERLITARGSAGRRPVLGAGTHSRVGANGERHYNVADAAAVLGVSHRELERMLDVGAAVAIAVLSVAPPPTDPIKAGHQPACSYLVPVVDPDGSRWVGAAELSRCELARVAGVTPEAIRSLGDSDDQLPIGEAARLVGVTNRYLRGVARFHEEHRAEIDHAIAAGRQPRRAYLAAHRGTNGRWLVTREDLAAFLERRRPPAVRVAYDLTLTTEKSLGVLALLAAEPVRREVLNSIQAGNDWALGWLEDRAVGRIDGSPVAAEGLMVASFRHLTSRARERGVQDRVLDDDLRPGHVRARLGNGRSARVRHHDSTNRSPELGVVGVGQSIRRDQLVSRRPQRRTRHASASSGPSSACWTVPAISCGWAATRCDGLRRVCRFAGKFTAYVGNGSPRRKP